jgi:putative transposase
MFQRGIDICDETGGRFGPMSPTISADSGRGFRHWQWHLDRVCEAERGDGLSLARSRPGRRDLERYITKTRDKDAALRFMKKTLKRHASPEAITKNGLRSHRAAMNELGKLTNRRSDAEPITGVENSHLSFGRRGRVCLRLTAPQDRVSRDI